MTGRYISRATEMDVRLTDIVVNIKYIKSCDVSTYQKVTCQN